MHVGKIRQYLVIISNNYDMHARKTAQIRSCFIYDLSPLYFNIYNTFKITTL